MIHFTTLGVQISFAVRYRVEMLDVIKVTKKTKQMMGKEQKWARKHGTGSFEDLPSHSLSKSGTTQSLAKSGSVGSMDSSQTNNTMFHGYHQDMHTKMEANFHHMCNGYMTVGRFANRAARIFMAMHPWTGIQKSSLYCPAKLRVLLQSARTFGCLMLSGVFFGASGNSSSVEAPPECKSDDFIKKMSMSFAIAIISSIISSVPLFVMLSLHKRDIVYVEEEQGFKRKKLIAKWYCEDMFLWIFGGSYTLASITFTMSFLANVTLEDHWNFLLAAATSLFKQLIMVPMMLALVLAILLTFGLNSPSVCDKVRQGLHIRKEEDIPEWALNEMEAIAAGKQPAVIKPIEDNNPSLALSDSVEVNLPNESGGPQESPVNVVVDLNPASPSGDTVPPGAKTPPLRSVASAGAKTPPLPSRTPPLPTTPPRTQSPPPQSRSAEPADNETAV